MYDHHIKDMAELVVSKLFPNSPTKEILTKTVEEILQEYWKDKIADVWTIEDVRSVGEDEDTPLTDEEAGEVLRLLLDNHDASVGINWDSIRYTIKTLKM